MLGRMGRNLTKSLGTAAAKQVMKGLVETYSSNWTFENVYELMARHAGVNELFPKEYLGVLREQGRRFPELQDSLELKEFLEWIQEGNALLFTEVMESPEVMRWLAQGWKQGWRALFTETSS